MLSPSVLNSTLVPRCSRIVLVVRLIMPWRLPVCWYFTLPDAVILKRFLAPDLVFNLGIWLSSSARGQATQPEYAHKPNWLGAVCSGLSVNRGHGSPYWPGSDGGVMAEAARPCNRQLCEPRRRQNANAPPSPDQRAAQSKGFRRS